VNLLFAINFDQILQSLKYVQLFAIVLGVCVTLLLDWQLSKLCRRGLITKRLYLRMRLINKTGIFAAAVVWSTLLIEISHNASVNFEALVSQDLWARISICTILSLNLYMIRRLALPRAKKRIGLSIYGGLTDSQFNRMLGIGAISSISWVALLLLWLLAYNLLPLQGQIHYLMIMAVYLAALGVALVFCNYRGNSARERFFKKLEKKKSRRNKVKRTNARRAYVEARKPTPRYSLSLMQDTKMSVQDPSVSIH